MTGPEQAAGLESEAAGLESAFVPGGPEFVISHGGYTAIVAAVGATLRSLTFEGRDLVVPYLAGEIRPMYRGATIAPWPNRIADGRYTFDGAERQVAVNEVDRNNALHGLVHWARWDLDEVGSDRVSLRHEIVAQDGYPHPIGLRITFQVGANGLTTTLRAVNLGDRPAPYGCCPHPYLKAGTGPVDNWVFTLPAATRLEVDPVRLLPTGVAAVDTVDSDFREPARIGHREIDHAFTDLELCAPGRTGAHLWNPIDRVGVRISWGEWAPWVQVHTADRPEPANNRVGLAVEPMNCPPDAFNSDPASVTLAAGGTHEAEWTIAALS